MGLIILFAFLNKQPVISEENKNTLNLNEQIMVLSKPIDIQQDQANVIESDSNTAKKIDNIVQQNKQIIDRINTLNIELEELEQVNATAVMKVKDHSKIAYLTFDDGPSDNTIKILDFLKLNNIKATFFVLGIPSRIDVYKRIVDEGHTLALHSNTHEYSDIYKDPQSFLDDIIALKDFIKKTIGYDAEILRFPGGSNNTISHKYGGALIMQDIIKTVNDAGYTYFDWNVDSMDASKNIQDKNIIVDAVIKQSSVLDQAVILMHDSQCKTTTVDALPEVVIGLKNLGFKFDKLTLDTPVVQFSSIK
ncbi:hypothetical protein AN641_01465 [Candidatus Epulonipiscioides gigas]|nr:hypothetical protein AN641_01465 [Epulopiscium sp. SCG-C07WGA-EpuloA2]